MVNNQQDPPEINENLQALRFEYNFRRYGVVFLAIIIIAALCGLFSSGFLSSAHKENPASSLMVDYDRFARLMSETEVNIQVKNSGLAHTSVDFSPALLSHYQIGDIRPQPDKMYSANGHLIWFTMKILVVRLFRCGYLSRQKHLATFPRHFRRISKLPSPLTNLSFRRSLNDGNGAQSRRNLSYLIDYI